MSGGGRSVPAYVPRDPLALALPGVSFCPLKHGSMTPLFWESDQPLFKGQKETPGKNEKPKGEKVG